MKVPQEIDGSAEHEDQYDEHYNECTENGEHITFAVVVWTDAIDLGSVAIILPNAWTDLPVGTPASENSKW